MRCQHPNRIAGNAKRKRGTLLLVMLTAGWVLPGLAAADSRRADRGGLTVPPELWPVVELGLRNSPTFRALFERLNTDPHVRVDLRLRTPLAGARTHSTLNVYRSPRFLDGRQTTCVSRLDGTVFVPPVVSRRDQIALLGHELLHVYRLLLGSRTESSRGQGERAALRLERRIRKELRVSDTQAQAAANVVDLRPLSSDLERECLSLLN